MLETDHHGWLYLVSICHFVVQPNAAVISSFWEENIPNSTFPLNKKENHPKVQWRNDSSEYELDELEKPNNNCCFVACNN